MMKPSGIREDELGPNLASAGSHRSTKGWSIDASASFLQDDSNLNLGIADDRLVHRDSPDVIWVPSEANLVRARLEFAARCLKESIDLSPEKRGGVPVVRGTRIPVSRVVAELADNGRLDEIADDYDLDPGTLRTLLEGLAAYLDQRINR